MTPAATSMKRTIQQERIANGLCPQCGGEAAPYYLCGKCRMLAKIGRVLRRAHGAGAVTKEMRGGKVYWRHASDEAWDSIAWRADPSEDDRRHRPRIRGVPVDVEKTILRLLRDQGRPSTVDEIVAAWGRLRADRKGTVIADMTRIIAAQRKREAKAARRLAQAQP